MENITIKTLAEFKQFLENKKNNEKTRVYISNGFHSDVSEIVKYYNNIYLF